MTEQPKLFEDAEDLLRALRENGVEHVVVGAHALAAHGIVRATGDLDVLVRPSRANAARIIRALIAFGAPLKAHDVTEDDFATPGTVYQLGLPPRRVDMMTRISGVDFDEAFETRLEVMIGGAPVPVLSREALIKNKRAAGRDKDLLDVRALERER